MSMLDEREFDANTFWRVFDAQCRPAFRGNGASAYERTSLLVLFLWSEQLSIAPKPLPRFDRQGAREYQEWWRDVVRRVNSRLGLEDEGRIGQDSVAIEFLIHALKTLHRSAEISPPLSASFFDYRFVRLVERETGTHRSLSHFSASLANALNSSDNAFVDVYCATGELFATSGNARWRRQDAEASRGYLFWVGSFSLEVRMRLALHGREPRSLERVGPDGYFGGHSMFRIDPPPRKALPRSDQHREYIESGASPTEMLGQMLRRLDIDLSLVVVPGSERSSSRRALRAVREGLIAEGRLAAVIDFPRVQSGRVEKSAWLVTRRASRLKGAVLMINTASLGEPSSHQEYGTLAEFSGRILRLLSDERLSHRWATSSQEDSGARYRHLFDREFAGEYRDVPGLCRLVTAQEIRDNAYALLASNYVGPITRSAWLSGINNAPLLDLLFEPGLGKTVYLIGNNGEGKSLLLRELAQASSEHQRKTIGISCSASDRFPLPSESLPGFEHFIYEGARTSSQAANLKKLATDVCRKFVLVHQSHEHLRVLEEVLRLLDFNARRYLMPLSAAADSPQAHADWVTSHTTELLDDAEANRHNTSGLNIRSMQVALMRSESKGGVTPFRDLSSGEQQIVSLVTRIIAHAERQCLFLIDEPEISLHVSWQRVLPRVLSVVSKRFSCDFLVATHSPLLISSVSDTSSVCLVAQMQQLRVIGPSDRRSVESVLFDGFGTHTANNRVIHERCAAIVAAAMDAVNVEQTDTAQLKRLITELREMRLRVSAASEQLDRISIDRSLEVIKAARDAILELTPPRQPESEEVEN
jgi:ABC-type transport system involved in cytochrome c biogenesis ATPase subunit